MKTQNKKRRVVESDDDTENTDLNTSKTSEIPPADKKRAKLIASDDEVVTPKKSKPSVGEKLLSAAKKKENHEEDEEKDSMMAIDSIHKTWTYEKFEFLQPNKIRDMNKNPLNHPDYDPRTLHVPTDFIEKQTPGHRQWWLLKSQYYDCIFFFKVGKFYELYHMDAVVGVKELGLTFMKGEYAHSGFPEKAYDKMASTLVERGYKVARIEQVETPAMMEKRCDADGKRTKNDKVVRREICQVSNIATQMYSSGLSSMVSGQISSSPNFILVIAEIIKTPSTSRYGICFVDTTIGDFTLGEFDDDQQCSRLLTLLSQYSPVLVLHSRQDVAEHTMKVIKNINAIKEKLTNEKQFWSPSKALKYLSETTFKKNEDWPECLKVMIKDNLMVSNFLLFFKKLLNVAYNILECNHRWTIVVFCYIIFTLVTTSC